MIGLGTIVNVLAIIAGSLIGIGLGDRLKERMRTAITDALGLLVGLVGALTLLPISGGALSAEFGQVVLLVILAAMLGGVLLGSALDIEGKLAHFGSWLRQKIGGSEGSARAKARFINGFVSGSLIFCIGPLAFLGALSDGLGQGASQLYLKSVLDFFTALALAASLGIGVASSALSAAILQGTLTLLGFFIGDVLPQAALDSMSVVGGLILIGMALRLLQLKEIKIADMLPALFLAPALVMILGVWL